MQQDNQQNDASAQALSAGENGKMPWTRPELLTLGETDDVMLTPGLGNDGSGSS
ncbi:MAG: hypothetical protein RL367_897 [Pseudomonadota bacterium]|jgi:hypothetical protein